MRVCTSHSKIAFMVRLSHIPEHVNIHNLVFNQGRFILINPHMEIPYMQYFALRRDTNLRQHHTKCPFLLKNKSTVYSDVGCRDVSGQKVPGLRDVHDLSDGCVSAADVKEATLQRVLTDHHGEENSHLIVLGIQLLH